MTYLKEALVIDTKTVRCGRCYKLKQDGKIDWMGFDQRKTVSICDVGSGNCQIVPSKDVEDVIVTKVKNSWETVCVILHLIMENFDEVTEIVGYNPNRRARTINKKWISVKTKKSSYWLCFDRMYQEKDDSGAIVHSIYGLIQFYRDIDTTHKAEGPNSRRLDKTRFRQNIWALFYPDSFENDEMSVWEWAVTNKDEIEYKCFFIDNSHGIVHCKKAYNPALTIYDEPEKIALQFIDFIKACEGR